MSDVWPYEEVLYMIARLCLPMRLQSENQLCLFYVQYARCLYATRRRAMSPLCCKSSTEQLQCRPTR